ncbi:Holliday junction branch migration protein RuvA [Caldalkalibacillus salinus]|uniref:Holliday junction branch migration protein RuvA n=1 Tax=Caldalkalibacillus salinus TaxID=2803787 RepID=UPI00192160C9|nr:Holliday junction branch migration protein RuvA [Caldalkalibacillus salinus]
MIDYIRGTLAHLDLDYVVLETHGVGYHIHCGNPYVYQGKEGQELILYTYQYVREDQLSLFGFATREERALFTRLLQVSGVGPKGALAIVASGQVWRVIEAIKNDHVNILTKFPGVGKKTAQRIILDLKDKLDDLLPHFVSEQEVSPTLLEDEAPVTVTSDYSDVQREALEALKALGYSDKEVKQVSSQLQKQGDEDWTTDQYIKKGLQLLMK